MKTKLKKLVASIAILTGCVAPICLLAEEQDYIDVYVNLQSKTASGIGIKPWQHASFANRIKFPGIYEDHLFGIEIENGEKVGGVRHTPGVGNLIARVEKGAKAKVNVISSVVDKGSNKSKQTILGTHLLKNYNERFQQSIGDSFWTSTMYTFSIHCKLKEIEGEKAYVIDFIVEQK